jgi:hypothetical protein
MHIGKSVRVAGMDGREIGFETFVNPGTLGNATAEGSKLAKYRIARWSDGLIVGGMRLGSSGSLGVKM